ncbi:BON domain-containing protein [Paraburkholderia pallida]|uniref:BON domain-containing protein n=1 Tax=Paraburkholderia pallida TaxID=2547399 RepID=A0A4P7D9Z7_9BURK|nr:BON domain-containing protein [Paraburkholderia pallida]QBR03694.1 BON domain-containing protein [Paraburkholderia pallida]
MIKIRWSGAIVFAAVALASLNSQAQGGESFSSGPATASSTKAVKAADRALQRSVRKALAKTKGLTITAVTVKARSGVVVLEGSVVDQSQGDLAAEVAAKVPGVNSVKNDLTVRPIQ